MCEICQSFKNLDQMLFCVISIYRPCHYTYIDIEFIFLFFCSFAYIEFSDRDSVTSAIGLHETLFRGRVLKVSADREMDQNCSQ